MLAGHTSTAAAGYATCSDNCAPGCTLEDELNGMTCHDACNVEVCCFQHGTCSSLLYDEFIGAKLDAFTNDPSKRAAAAARFQRMCSPSPIAQQGGGGDALHIELTATACQLADTLGGGLDALGRDRNYVNPLEWDVYEENAKTYTTALRDVEKRTQDIESERNDADKVEFLMKKMALMAASIKDSVKESVEDLKADQNNALEGLNSKIDQLSADQRQNFDAMHQDMYRMLVNQEEFSREQQKMGGSLIKELRAGTDAVLDKVNAAEANLLDSQADIKAAVVENGRKLDEQMAMLKRLQDTLKKDSAGMKRLIGSYEAGYEGLKGDLDRTQALKAKLEGNSGRGWDTNADGLVDFDEMRGMVVDLQMTRDTQLPPQDAAALCRMAASGGIKREGLPLVKQWCADNVGRRGRRTGGFAKFANATKTGLAKIANFTDWSLLFCKAGNTLNTVLDAASHFSVKMVANRVKRTRHLIQSLKATWSLLADKIGEAIKKCKNGIFGAIAIVGKAVATGGASLVTDIPNIIDTVQSLGKCFELLKKMYDSIKGTFVEAYGLGEDLYNDVTTIYNATMKVISITTAGNCTLEEDATVSSLIGKTIAFGADNLELDSFQKNTTLRKRLEQAQGVSRFVEHSWDGTLNLTDYIPVQVRAKLGLTKEDIELMETTVENTVHLKKTNLSTLVPGLLKIGMHALVAGTSHNRTQAKKKNTTEVVKSLMKLLGKNPADVDKFLPVVAAIQSLVRNASRLMTEPLADMKKLMKHVPDALPLRAEVIVRSFFKKIKNQKFPAQPYKQDALLARVDGMLQRVAEIAGRALPSNPAKELLDGGHDGTKLGYDAVALFVQKLPTALGANSEGLLHMFAKVTAGKIDSDSLAVLLDDLGKQLPDSVDEFVASCQKATKLNMTQLRSFVSATVGPELAQASLRFQALKLASR